VRHVLHGVPRDEIACEMALTTQASKSLVLRARRELHRCAGARR
jgi:DNA-directed RNA polymerase specialized sigma24 family protein